MGIDLYLIFALVSTSFLGLIKILSIVPFNRLAADDFSFTVSLLNSSSIFSFVRGWYVSLTARYTANILIGFFGILSGSGAKPYISNLFTVVFGLFSLAFFISSLLKIKIFSWMNVLLANIIFVTYYIITPSQRESWYWLNSAVTYLWPAFFNLIILSLLLKRYKSWIVYILLFVLTFLTGGLNECILVVNFLLSGITLIYLLMGKYYKNLPKVISQKIIKKFKSPDSLLKQIWFVFLGAFLSLIIIYFSPAKDARMQSPTSSPMSFFGSLAYSFRDGPLLVWEIFKNNVLLLISLFFSLTYLFSKLKVKKKDLNQKDKEKYLNLIMFIASSPVFLSIIFTMIGYLSLGRVLEVRAFAMDAFGILMALILCSYCTSFLFEAWSKNFQNFFLSFVLVSSVLIFISGIKTVSTLAEDVYIARNYSQAFDQMFTDLRSRSDIKDNEVIQIKQLPPSGLVKFWQVTGNTADWENQVVPAFLKINGILQAN